MKDKMDEALDKLMVQLNDEERKLAINNKFPYLFSKAFNYLKIGVIEYRRNDYFEMPPKDLDKDELDAIESGCKQIINGMGFNANKPFTNINIRGFNLLFELMHFKTKSRISTSTLVNGEIFFVDEIKLKHMIDGSEITYYNLVQYI